MYLLYWTLSFYRVSECIYGSVIYSMLWVVFLGCADRIVMMMWERSNCIGWFTVPSSSEVR